MWARQTMGANDGVSRHAQIAGETLFWILLYMLGMYYSNAYVVGPSQVTLFWPAAGIAFAVVMGRGVAWAVIIPLAVLLSHATFASVPAVFLPFSVMSNMLGSLVGARMVRSNTLHRFNNVQAAFALAAGAALMAATSAAIGTIGLLVAEMIPVADALPAYVKWLLGDLLGVVCIAPTLLLLMVGRRGGGPDQPIRSDYASAGEKMAWVAVYLASYAFVYWTGTQNSGYALGMIAFPLALLLWSGFRFQPLWTAIGTLTAVFVVTSLTGFGLAGFKAPTTLLDVVLLLGFLTLVAALPLILMASVNQQRVSARRALRLAAETAIRQQDELERLVAERTSQLDEANRQLEHASQTDALTGLRNRRYLSNQLPLDLEFYRRESMQAGAPPHVLMFVMVDIDHFKRINDAHGHKAGDEVLQQFANLLTRLVRSSDYAIRWGGEEFLLVLRPMPSELVRTIGNRICSSVAAHPFEFGGGQRINLTCSAGFAKYDMPSQTPASSWERPVELADAALYWMKQNGRNGWALLQPTLALDLDTALAPGKAGVQRLIDTGQMAVISGSGIESGAPPGDLESRPSDA